MKKYLKVIVCLLIIMVLNAGGVCAEEKKPVEIVFWGDWGGQGEIQFNTMLEDFNVAHPGIKAKYVVTQGLITKFLTGVASGNVPDILYWDRWRTALYAPKGAFQPIDEYMEKDNIEKEEFFSEAIRELTSDGKLYGLPITVDNRSLYYNKEMLREKGLTPPTTWEELRQAAIKLAKWDGDRLILAGMSLQDVGLFSMWIWQAGGRMVTDDGTKTAFNSPEGLKVLEFWDQLVNKDKVYKWGFEVGLRSALSPFITRKVAMLYEGPWMLSTYKKYGKGLEFGVVPPPAGPNGNKGAMMGGFGLVIPKDSKHKAEAWELIRWWLSEPENAIKWSKMSLNIPTHLEAIKDPFFATDEYFVAFLETMKFARIRPPLPNYPQMEIKVLIPELQLFMEGKISAKEALEKAAEIGDKILQEKE